MFSFDAESENGNSKKNQEPRQGAVCGVHLLSDFSACVVLLDWPLELVCNLASRYKNFCALCRMLI